MTELKFTIPWPPTVNHYWVRRRGGGMAVGAKGREYRKTVSAMLMAQKVARGVLDGRLKFKAVASPPDHRARDLDNLLKAALDSLVETGVVMDDEHIDDLHISRAPVSKPGHIEITISEVGSAFESSQEQLAPEKTVDIITVSTKSAKAGPARKKSKKSAAAPKAPQSLGGSNKPSAPEASPLSHPVVEVAEAYAPGFAEDWIGAAAYIHDLMKHGVKLTQLIQASTQYRRQQAAQQAFDRQAGKPIKPAMKPSEFFGSEAWQGKFPMPVDPKVQEAEDETEMTNEAWLRSKFARA